MICRSVLAAFCGFAMLTAAQAQPVAPPPQRVVNVYNWSDYVDPRVLEEFTAATGIRVVYDTYDNNEIVETRLLAGKSGFDVVVPSGPFLSRLIKAGVLARIDRARLTQASHIWPEIDRQLERHDPGNAHAVNYMWGTVGIGLNTRKVRERLGQTLPLNSWDLILKPELAAKLKDCGIHVLDAPEDVVPGLLRALKLNPDSKDAKDWQRAIDALMRVRPSIARVHSSAYINALATGDACLVIGYSGDILQARKRAEDARNGIEISYEIPREGALMWFDSMAIPADAANIAEATIFIDWMMRPDISARNANLTAFASGNLTARRLIKPEITADPNIYPDENTLKRLFTTSAADDKLQAIIGRLWSRFRTGR
jgi:putrescine transport system substrate-binding protein